MYTHTHTNARTHTGQAMVNALFNHTFVIGSIDTSNSQQDPNGRLQELLRNLNDRSPTPPPPKPYSGPPQETKYEFPAEGGEFLSLIILNAVTCT